MSGPVFICFLFQGFLLCGIWAWEVKMPNAIQGLKGSCLVIPCSFSYFSYPPKDPRRIVWYQYVSSGYPLVCDPQHPDEVIKEFRGKTYIYGRSSGDCSLLIRNLQQLHHKEKIYAWIDPDNVGSRTYTFYDVTSTIYVNANPEKPSISVYGGVKMGDGVTVICFTHHTCPYSNPSISLNGVEGSDAIKHDLIKDGLWKTTLTRTGVIKSENSTVKCDVKHYGGVIATEIKHIHAACFLLNIKIEPEMADFTEGVPRNFLCSVHHSCTKEKPILTWNYKNMTITEQNKKLTDSTQVTYSNVSFLGENKDHGKKLTCNAIVSAGTITASVVLLMKRTTHFGMKSPELYILLVSFVFLLCGLVAGVVVYKRKHCSDKVNGSSKNKPAFSKPRMPSPKSARNVTYIHDYEVEYGNVTSTEVENSNHDNLYGNV